MQGHPEIISLLNEVLKQELTAISQYFLHAKMCQNWGYFRLAAYNRKESIEEMVHAEKLMDRILYLDGTPNMTDMFKVNVGANVRQQLENDLALEMEAVPRLREAIRISEELKDHGSRELFTAILVDEEHHIDYLEGQLHAVREIGIENYLAQQLHAHD